MPAAPPSRSLLLNASLEPLCVVTMHRAVLLVLTGKATVLEADDRLLHSERSAVPAPLVLCLTRYVHVPMRRTVPPTRRTVLLRDGHRCAYCGATADTVDHVHPRSRVICGGLLPTRDSHHRHRRGAVVSRLSAGAHDRRSGAVA